MRAQSSPLIVLSALFAIISLGACEKPQSSIQHHAAVKPAAIAPTSDVVKNTEKKPAEAKKEKPSYYYSPFVLSVRSNQSLFKKISFKDVGVKALNDDLRKSVYEVMAQSLASELSIEHSLSMPANVVYDEAITDPSNHLACGSDHLYVDVWQSEAPKRWGYSLWSGCGEDDNFAWKEVSFTPHPQGDLKVDVKPLAQSIVASIREANQKGCYQKTC